MRGDSAPPRCGRREWPAGSWSCWSSQNPSHTISTSHSVKVKTRSHINTVELLLWSHPFCTRKVVFQEGWPLIRVKINTFMFRFTLSSDLSRGGGLLSGWFVKRGSTVYQLSDPNSNGKITFWFLNKYISMNKSCIPWHSKIWSQIKQFSSLELTFLKFHDFLSFPWSVRTLLIY